jgi:hypothetical protein
MIHLTIRRIGEAVRDCEGGVSAESGCDGSPEEFDDWTRRFLPLFWRGLPVSFCDIVLINTNGVYPEQVSSSSTRRWISAE